MVQKLLGALTDGTAHVSSTGRTGGECLSMGYHEGYQ